MAESETWADPLLPDPRTLDDAALLELLEENSVDVQEGMRYTAHIAY